MPTGSEADRQLPLRDEVFLDHVGHFVPDISAAANAMLRAGFAPAPVSVQVNEQPDGTTTPTGTGNVTAMLDRGYIEVLFKTADTPLGREFAAAMDVYTGLHLVAFATDDARREHARLEAEGFHTRPLVELRRPVATGRGEDIAAFSVARVAPADMAEGRVQLLTHHTEAAVWQPRWLSHPNGVIGLLDAVIVVDNVGEAAARFARFSSRKVTPVRSGLLIRLDRGGVLLIGPDDFQKLGAPVSAPPPPYIAAYGLRVRDLAVIETWVTSAGLAHDRRDRLLVAAFPAELGVGAWFFVESIADLPWRRDS